MIIENNNNNKTKILITYDYTSSNKTRNICLLNECLNVLYVFQRIY